MKPKRLSKAEWEETLSWYGASWETTTDDRGRSTDDLASILRADRAAMLAVVDAAVELRMAEIELGKAASGLYVQRIPAINRHSLAQESFRRALAPHLRTEDTTDD